MKELLQLMELLVLENKQQNPLNVISKIDQKHIIWGVARYFMLL